MKQYWLFNPGPVNTSPTVRQAAISVDLCHREPEYAKLMQDLRAKLVSVGGLANAYRSVLISGSGTSAVELSVAGIIRDGQSVLVVRNGVYGDRIARMVEMYGATVRTIDTSWTERPPIEAVENMFKRHPDIGSVAMVHHETTTGLINPVREVGSLCAEYNKIFVLDSVSGFGGESIDIEASHVDILSCTANKCLHGLPGISFVILSPHAQEYIQKTTAKSLYFDLRNYLKLQDQGDIPFTPCVPATLALNQSLDELVAFGGIAARIEIYRSRANRIRAGLTKTGFDLYLSEELRSNTITTFKLPNNVSYPALHDALKEKGFVIYAGQGKLASEIFRIANMGEVPMKIYDELIDTTAKFLLASR